MEGPDRNKDEEMRAQAFKDHDGHAGWTWQ